MANEQVTEIWKEIEGFPGYRISNLGRAQTRRQINRWHCDDLLPAWRDLMGRVHRKGYVVIALWQHCKCKQVYLHRLVLELFVGPCPEGMICCHNNGNPRDNRVTNLRWDTYKENTEDIRRHGRQLGAKTSASGDKHRWTKIKDADVVKIFSLKKIGMSHKQLASMFGVTDVHIRRILKGQRKCCRN